MNPALLNNNQNTTFNYGRDVLNYNPVTNIIYLTEAEVCHVGQPLPDTYTLPYRRTS